MIMNKMRPVHPGEVLSEELETRGLKRAELAKALHVSPRRVGALVNGERRITADTALRLARFFGSSAEMWMAMQQAYDIRVAELTIGNDIKRTVTPLS